MGRTYSKIHSLLITDERDVIGHIAYSLYKKEKSEYIDNYKKNNNKEPTEKDLEKFTAGASVPSRIESFRDNATKVLQMFTNKLLAEDLKQMKEEVRKEQKDIQKDVLDEMLPKALDENFKWWPGIWQSVAGAFIFALIVAGITFIANNKGAIQITIGTQHEEKTIGQPEVISSQADTFQLDVDSVPGESHRN